MIPVSEAGSSKYQYWRSNQPPRSVMYLSSSFPLVCLLLIISSVHFNGYSCLSPLILWHCLETLTPVLNAIIFNFQVGYLMLVILFVHLCT